ASGDLAKRKLLPAIYELAKENLLCENTYVVGFSRSHMTDEQYRKVARESIEKFSRSKPFDPELWKKLEPRFFYAAADYGSSDDHGRVADTLAKLDKQFGNTKNSRLYYLSTPPETFDDIITRLGEREHIER